MAEAEGGAVSSLNPHCILTVSLQREVSVESYGVERWWVVVAATMEGGRGGGRWSMTLYPHCIPTVSSLYLSKQRRQAGGGGERHRRQQHLRRRRQQRHRHHHTSTAGHLACIGEVARRIYHQTYPLMAQDVTYFDDRSLVLRSLFSARVSFRRKKAVLIRYHRMMLRLLRPYYLYATIQDQIRSERES